MIDFLNFTASHCLDLRRLIISWWLFYVSAFPLDQMIFFCPPSIHATSILDVIPLAEWQLMVAFGKLSAIDFLSLFAGPP
jgi:hypothetical protein